MKEITYEKYSVKGQTKWSYRFELPSVDGKRSWCKHQGFDTKALAAEDADKRRSEIFGGRKKPLKADSITYGEFVNKVWLKSDDVSELEVVTLTSYKKRLKNHILPVIGNKVLSAVSNEQLQAMLRELYNRGYTQNTLGNIRGLLSKTFRYAKKKNYILVNPADDLKTSFRALPQKESRDNPHICIPKADIRKIFEKFPRGSSDYLAMYIAYTCGLRLGEVFALCFEDFDLENGILNVCRQIQYNESTNKLFFKTPKYNGTRAISISPDVVETIKFYQQEVLKNQDKYGEYYQRYYINGKLEYRAEAVKTSFNYELLECGETEVHLINVRENGTYVQPRTMQYTSAVIRKEINSEFDFHSFRHTHATMLLDAGLPMPLISQRLGHVKQDTTKIYTNHITEHMKKVERDILKLVYADK